LWWERSSAREARWCCYHHHHDTQVTLSALLETYKQISVYYKKPTSFFFLYHSFWIFFLQYFARVGGMKQKKKIDFNLNPKEIRNNFAAHQC
jgi:hypothetical protein